MKQIFLREVVLVAVGAVVLAALISPIAALAASAIALPASLPVAAPNAVAHATVAIPTTTPATQSWSPLTARTLSGSPVDLLRQPGWRVIYFWSAECPCVKACESFSLRPLANKYAGKVRFYAVVSGKYDLDTPLAQLSQDIAAHKLPYPVLLDSNHTVAKTLNAEVTPEVYLIDPQNRILYSGMPDDSKRFLLDTGNYGVTKSYLARALAQALAGKRVTTPRTQNEGCSIAW